MDFITKLRKRISDKPVRIIYPEGTDLRILIAAVKVNAEKNVKPILIGPESEIVSQAESENVSLDGIEIIDPSHFEKLDDYVQLFAKETGFPEIAARVVIKKPLGLGAAMIRFGDADAMVAGAINTSADVIQNSKQIIGLKKGISAPSSLMVMQTPHYQGAGDHALIFADPGVNPHPNSSELADIAITSAQSAGRLFGWKPRVAMLSFSTQGSAKHPDVEHVVKALEIAKERAPHLQIDGEMQADAALNPAVAHRKMKKASGVAGRANILIFPDLDAANIGFKLVQQLGDASAYGPFLLGFNKPVSDLSRGSTVDDIVGVSFMAALEFQGQNQQI
ncbi:phosphate acyltransferase [Secundilactobacillus folii]|uniref:Phosphotransacetylase n=1 Tax=Secundilactobacillus folii TaxID=2678357 RepID=A0A7X3C3M3_9LACO|nr:phosphate acyltransferase [Secundilactobacillus folii]MTV82756.1 phosphotransacetylase [Secundilactobacillus folii]